MRVVVVNQFYWPSIAATAQLLTDLCESVARRGHEVTVVCSQGDYAGGAERLPARETHNGVRIKRLPATSFGKGSKVARVTDYGSFYGLATAALLSTPGDLYLCLSTPPLIALPALMAARLRRKPVVYWCQDVYPDMAVALGVLAPDGAIAKVLDTASRHVLRNARRTVAIGERMAAVLAERGADAPAVVHNWSDGDAVNPATAVASHDNRYRRAAGAGDGDVLVVYAGNMGLAHDFSGLGYALNAIADHPEVERLRFLFVGAGSRLKELEAFADNARRRGVRVAFMPYQPREDLPELLTSADVHLVCVSADVSGLMVPSKLYGAMAAGRAVLLAGPGGTEVADVLSESGGGRRVEPDDGPGMVQAFRALVADTDALREQGRRARVVFDARFSRAEACERFIEVLEEAAS